MGYRYYCPKCNIDGESPEFLDIAECLDCGSKMELLK